MLLILVLVMVCFRNGFAQIATYDVRLDDLLKMQKGIGWPHELHVAEGQEALLKLSSTIDGMESCEVTPPGGVPFNVQTPPDNRYESWSDDCGVRVRRIAKTDEGRWRLTASRGSDSVTGWVGVNVQEGIVSYQTPPIYLQDGGRYTVNLTSLDSMYCVVSKPFSESSLVPGHCSVTLDRTTRAIQGNWNVLLGLPGQVREVHLDKNVALVEPERFDVGYVRDTSANKLHMYCNILHTAKNITFCRFQKTTDAAGYNVMDGLSDGSHSYYGEGFVKRQCGMTIETVSSQDYGTWRCTVGVQAWVGTHLREGTPMQALINVPLAPVTRINRGTESDDVESTTIFVQKDRSFTINCRADTSLMYCWFQHPNGSHFTPLPLTDEDNQDYWFTGESLQSGDCGITFAHVRDDDEGEWTCHMGSRNQLGVELIEKVNVRVTGPLAAVQKVIDTRVGDTTVIYCHTSNGNRPLNYCRFRTPNFVGFRIDATVTEDNAILDRFTFTPERNLDIGDCSVTINPVLAEDIGEWTCGALLDNETEESYDTVELRVEGTTPQFRAGIVGMSVGLSVLLLVLGGFLLYKKRDALPWPNSNISNRTDILELDSYMDDSSYRSSTTSSTSNETATQEQNRSRHA